MPGRKITRNKEKGGPKTPPGLICYRALLQTKENSLEKVTRKTNLKKKKTEKGKKKKRETKNSSLSNMWQRVARSVAVRPGTAICFISREEFSINYIGKCVWEIYEKYIGNRSEIY